MRESVTVLALAALYTSAAPSGVKAFVAVVLAALLIGEWWRDRPARRRR